MEHDLPKNSFPAEVDNQTQVLVLGSLPGDESLRRVEYYGHPQNRFWRILSEVTESPLPTNYEAKLALLHLVHIGLWDVAGSAVRPGSMDTNIKGEEPNDIPGFLASHPSIRAVVFNGRKAEQLYDKHFERLPHLRYFSLPSTSPANAAFSLQRLREHWKVVATLIGEE